MLEKRRHPRKATHCDVCEGKIQRRPARCRAARQGGEDEAPVEWGNPKTFKHPN